MEFEENDGKIERKIFAIFFQLFFFEKFGVRESGKALF